MSVLKEWPISLWVVLRNGLPFDYAFGRSAAFKMRKRCAELETGCFWSVAPYAGTISIKVKS